MPENGAQFLLAFIGLVVIVLLVLLQLTRLGYLIRATIPDRPRQRMFIASVSFLITFTGVRILVHRIATHEGHLQWVTVHGMHIHHLVWGILLLLLTGFATLNEAGEECSPVSILVSRTLAIGYGIGAALTLDEFALWLNLANVYWSREGRESIDAVVLFGSLMAIGTWGAPLFSSILRKK